MTSWFRVVGRHPAARLFVWVATATATVLAAGPTVAENSSDTAGIGESRAILPLVTETVRGGESKTESPRYWWSQPDEPAWTETDRVIKEALEERGVAVVEPPEKTRLSRVYRRPDLSVENIAGLASVVGADRVLSGDVFYEPVGLTAPGMTGVRVTADLQVLDVGGVEPEELRTFELSRSGWGTDRKGALSDARRALGASIGALVGRVAAAASGPVGVEGREPHLVFHTVRRQRALQRIRRGLRDLEIVDATRVAWMAEGLLALEINPGRRDEWARVDKAAEQLLTANLQRMQVERRSRERGPVVEFDVTLDDSFGADRRREGRSTDE